jgi:rod shape-determining protein MreC
MREATRARAVLGVLLLVSITLILLDVRGSSAIGGLRGLTSAVVGPVPTAVAGAASPFVTMAQSATNFGNADERSAVAASQIGEVSGNPITQQDALRAGTELAAMLQTAGVGGYQVLPARVVAYGSAQTFNGTVTIDAGSGDSITRDMSVMNGQGLVGKVIEVGPTTATVQLATDDDSVIGARLVPSGEAGALQGTGQPGESILRLLNPTAPVAEGDQLVTFGSPEGRPYVAGLPLGTVVGFRGEPGQADRAAVISPAARMGALDVVGVVVDAPRTVPREAVTPTVPTPAPAPTDPSSAGR